MTDITPKLVDYLLYNLPSLQEQYESALPKSTQQAFCVIPRHDGGKKSGSQVETIAIRRATLALVIDAVVRAIKGLPPDARKVYRMKYRAYMRHWQIAERTHFSEKTIDRKVDSVRNAVAQQLQGLPGHVLNEMLSAKCRQNVGK